MAKKDKMARLNLGIVDEMPPKLLAKKIAEISGKDCRDCKKWNDCECGKNGHDKGTSIGYSVGECAEYEVTKDDN